MSAWQAYLSLSTSEQASRAKVEPLLSSLLSCQSPSSPPHRWSSLNPHLLEADSSSSCDRSTRTSTRSQEASYPRHPHFTFDFHSVHRPARPPIGPQGTRPVPRWVRRARPPTRTQHPHQLWRTQTYRHCPPRSHTRAGLGRGTRRVRLLVQVHRASRGWPAPSRSAQLGRV